MIIPMTDDERRLTEEYLYLVPEMVKKLTTRWHHLIRMTMESIGGRGALKDLYDLLKEHPKAKKNPHYQERIRATLYEHPDEYIPVSKGYFRLSYPVT